MTWQMVPVRVIDPCATCDRPENDHAGHCLMHPDNWGREAIPSDIPGTAAPIARNTLGLR